MIDIEPYTVAVTSCGRFDLLRRTLCTLLPKLEGSVARIIVIEDSGNYDVIDTLRPFVQRLSNSCYMPSANFLGEGIDVIVNDRPLGQIRSIDRLYSHINTEWLFHCEDDWEFYGREFIRKSFVLMKEFNNISTVSIRGGDILQRMGYLLPQEFEFSSVRYRTIDPSNSRNWLRGLTFNPGLRRMRDYRIVGSYADIGVTSSESRVSDIYLALGYTFVYLCEPAAKHIGVGGRHVIDPTKFRKKFFPKLKYSIRKRVEHICRKMDHASDPCIRAIRRYQHSEAVVTKVTN